MNKLYPNYPWNLFKDNEDYPEHEVATMEQFTSWYALKYQLECPYNHLRALQFLAVEFSKMKFELSDPAVEIIIRDLDYIK